MEHLYNPDQMSEQEIKATFVARQALVDRLVTLIERQPEGAGVRHVVLVAPRGMGKTTMLLMIQFAIADRGLAPPWLPIRFPEELYGVTDLADFWLETLDNVARTTGDAALSEAMARLKARYPASEQLQEATLALLRDWCRQNNRRLVLLVDNFHLILSQINDEQQNAALRHVLMNEGWVMLLGAAPSFFKEASRYDEPLYNFFQIERLERLTFEDMRALLLQRAAADGLTDFAKTLDANTTRLRVLEYFTGGNARLVLMLYQIITRSEVSEVRRGLELLLDQVTPYYKDKTEALPAQQRKILDHIARASSQTHEGVSPSEIALAVRLTAQTVSAQLKRLTEQGYVQPANLRGRNTFYTLSEPLYSLWYQMRFGRDTRQKMSWLVEFLRTWYGNEGLENENLSLDLQFDEAIPDDGWYTVDEIMNRLRLAHKTLEFRQYIAAAFTDETKKNQLFQSVASRYRDLVSMAWQIGRSADALSFADRWLEIDPDNLLAWFMRGLSLNNLGRNQEALSCVELVIKKGWSDNQGAWLLYGVTLNNLRRYEEAVAALDRAALLLQSDQQHAQNLIYVSYFQFRINLTLKRYEEAKRTWSYVMETASRMGMVNCLQNIAGLTSYRDPAFAGQAITASCIKDQFFPLTRALDYIATGDEGLIEKLTPEMRPIVEEVVAKLRPATEAADIHTA